MNRVDAAELPGVAGWQAAFTPPVGEVDYLSEHLNVASALLFSRLLYPELILVEGCVLRADAYQAENLSQWLSDPSRPTSAIEAVLNKLHLWDIFKTTTDVEELALAEIGQTLSHTWLAAARSQFPEDEFRCELTDDYGPTVTLFRVTQATPDRPRQPPPLSEPAEPKKP